ncbi:vitamin B12-dependent ribonucleotide reductase [Elysia marginata]|uniref:Vitamin B12-dependent ribonucleotide reductase n=1 Tax=Elysia marginata TaxID=1093978 RepID=A0AAV4JIT1_9GAST|nr:vitamin B12-dependent ribonucleotide reductase [Elysia marginata]
MNNRSAGRQEWLAYCDSTDIMSKFRSFRANRFNPMFENVEAFMDHKEHRIKDCLSNSAASKNKKFSSIEKDREDVNLVSIVGDIALFSPPVSSLHLNGLPPKDMRGHHALTDEERGLTISHIQFFRGRFSHYSRRKTRKVYLPEDLNISKMHSMFMEKHPNVKCSYDSYRGTFNNKFNISFGYPRKVLID